jgi:hypothetical protein
MKSLKRSLLAVAGLALVANPSPAAEDQAAATVEIDGVEWHSLFNGEDLTGWKPGGENPDSFAVEDGNIVVEGPRDHLYYAGPVPDADFDDFHFRCEVRTEPKANSGVFFHTQWQERGWPSVGYEAQVNASHGDAIKTGSVYAVANVMNDAPHEDGEWFLYEILVEGDTITLKVDDDVVNKYTEKPGDVRGKRKLSSGTFALQAHDPESRVMFRNLYVRPLGGE